MSLKKKKKKKDVPLALREASIQVTSLLTMLSSATVGRTASLSRAG